MHSSLAGRALSGIAGAVATTLVHETARKRLRHAPRMDLVGERALARILKASGRRVPRRGQLYGPTLAAELLSNSAWYAMTSGGRRPVLRSTVLGAIAGLGGVFLTPLLGLGRRSVLRSPRTAIMTTGWYTLGGLVSGLVQRALRSRHVHA